MNPAETLKRQVYGAHYDTAIKIFKNNILLGTGLKNFRNESGKSKYFNKEFSFTDSRQATHPHQLHFEILSELGLIGYILFILLFYFTFSSAIKIYYKRKNLFQLSSLLFILATLIPLLPSGSFFTTYTATIFWINYGLLIYRE